MSKSVTVLTKKSRASDEKRTQYVTDYYESGMTKSEFAKTIGVHPTTVRNWLEAYKKSQKKLSAHSSEDAPESTNEVGTPKDQALQAFSLPDRTREQLVLILNENQVLKDQVTRLTTELDEYKRVLGESLFESKRKRVA